jgi:hypothetical protein
VDTLDDEQLGEAEDGAVGTSTWLAPEADEVELALLRQVDSWACGHEGWADTTARELISFLQAACRPDGTHRTGVVREARWLRRRSHHRRSTKRS